MSERWLSAAVIVRNTVGECLLLQRGPTAPWEPNKWNLPGGNQDPGETLEENARREALEEAGIVVGALRLVEVVKYPNSDLYVYEAREWTGEPRMCWESQAMVWAPLDKIPEFEMVPLLGKVFEKLEPYVACKGTGIVVDRQSNETSSK